MKRTWLHYFYARNLPAWIWLSVVPIVPVLVVAGALGTPGDLRTLGPETRSYLFLLGTAWLLGFLVGGLVGRFILGPLYHHRAQLNGYPYRAGDRVEILVGANRGRIAPVVDVWDQRGEVRVELPAQAERKMKCVFHFTQVIRVSDAEASAAADQSDPTGG